MLTLAQILPPVSVSPHASITVDPNRAHMLTAADWALIASLLAVVAAVILGRYLWQHARSVTRARALHRPPVRIATAVEQAVSIVEAVAAEAGVHDVWVNPRSGIYFTRGHRWYEATQHGFRLSPEEANARGYRPSTSKAAPKQTARS